MSTSIGSNGQHHWVSNKRLDSLLAFGLQVGESQAGSEQEQRWVENLRQFSEELWPGKDLDLDEQFPSIEEKKFWARIYHDVARAIFLREIGNHKHTFWQSSTIGDAYFIVRMLTQAVCQTELGWHTETGNMREFDALNDAQEEARQTNV